MVNGKLLRAIVEQYVLPWNGRHGLGHWIRVLENGLHLARETGVNTEVVELFSLFHDAKRVNEGSDAGHGGRGADLARSWRGKWFDLGDEDMGLLTFACAGHTDGITEAERTVQVCWDADRLDLNRVNIQPRPELLCTKAAKDPKVIAWADRRARSEFVNPVIWQEWLPHLTGLLGGTN